MNVLSIQEKHIIYASLDMPISNLEKIVHFLGKYLVVLCANKLIQEEAKIKYTYNHKNNPIKIPIRSKTKAVKHCPKFIGCPL